MWTIHTSHRTRRSTSHLNYRLRTMNLFPWRTTILIFTRSWWLVSPWSIRTTSLRVLLVWHIKTCFRRSYCIIRTCSCKRPPEVEVSSIPCFVISPLLSLRKLSSSMMTRLSLTRSLRLRTLQEPIAQTCWEVVQLYSLHSLRDQPHRFHHRVT
jgi:hypothetical protein